MALTIITLAERPELKDAVNAMETGWPEFMFQDPMGWNLGSCGDLFPEYQLIGLDGDVVVAKGFSAPVPWPFEIADLPDQGWDEIIGRAIRGSTGARPPTLVSALEITVDPGRRGEGLSTQMVAAMRDNARRRGFRDLVAPVRPNAKKDRPNLPMSDYVALRRDDGLPVDPWLRVHARLGGVIVRVCPAAMSIGGSLAQWRRWTGLPFDRDGDVFVEGALGPVHVCVAHDHAVYVEANVWMHHRLGGDPGLSRGATRGGSRVR